MGRVVLVTGVAGDIGGRFARRIAEDPAVERVVGVDAAPPRADLGRVGFVRADIRNPVIAKVIAGQDVDTVVHLSVQPERGLPRGSAKEPVGSAGPGSTATKEHNVIGTMQLLAACQRAEGLQRLVVRSAAAVYGSSSRDPAMFTEDMSAKRLPRTGYAKDVLEVEGYVRGFARRRPDVAVTTLRAADVVGPTVSSPLTDYLRLPVVPTTLGYDARLQLLHEDDLLDALHHASLGGVHGTFNVAGDGVLMLSQAIRRLGRPTVAVPGFALSAMGTLTRQATLRSLQTELAPSMSFGRGLDTTRMRTVLGFTPAHTTGEAFADFARTVRPRRSQHRTGGGRQPLATSTGGDHG
jgi:UDP-glucose 4-epimerase